MIKSKTPRTDEAIVLFGDYPCRQPGVPIEFSEKLETELNAANERAEKYREIAEQAITPLCRSEYHEDGNLLREKLEELKKLEPEQ